MGHGAHFGAPQAAAGILAPVLVGWRLGGITSKLPLQRLG